MKLKSILLAVLITLSTILFGVTNVSNAETKNSNSTTSVLTGEIRVEYVVINGVLWKIVYDSDENIIQASAVVRAD
jgi:hypothetical protein